MSNASEWYASLTDEERKQEEHVKAWVREIEELKRRRRVLMRFDCNRTVMNKLDKVSKKVTQDRAKILDVHIHEYPGISWQPELDGTFGGYFYVLIDNASSFLINHLTYYIPLAKNYGETTATEITLPVMIM